ncbi:MAG: UDP-N-acetylmuramoyl-tripeptide--D-alanyl-D-alanine ligase [bacterium]|nr:MAG: UDP-N-acetylmuramoyl-tripeptide--D-alanyl-D-alanine ligase [bacterium]
MVIRVELRWIAEALKNVGEDVDDPGEGCVEGVSIDTRSGCAGALFVALKGECSDGHSYLTEAVERGAAALLVSRKRRSEAESAAGGLPVFSVGETLLGLQALAASYRERVGPRVVAVTGSTGKTGTKDMIAGILARRFKVHATPGNLNNHIGLPLTLLGMEGEEDVLVAEMGANHKNEISRLASIAKPEIGVVTNIGPCHLEFFGSLAGVAEAKAELVEALTPAGTAVLPADDEFFCFLRERTSARVVSFGLSEASDWRIGDIEVGNGGGYRFTIGSHPMRIARYGRHNILNAAAAATVGFLLEVPPETVAEALAGVGAADGRGILYDVGGILVADESYNANPDSIRAAVDGFVEIPVSGKRWLVIGDMLELGDHSIKLHAEVGVHCGRAGVDGIFTLGAETVELSRAAAAQRRAPGAISHFLGVETLAEYLNGLLSEGDAVLVKGSRGMHMERVIEELERLRSTARRRVD